ncbi:hypothetical protein KP806_08615 [Paenibacillus sp. N4]|uniref:RNase H family protein n=1 Tax=Paenibacillus vietnamensis TaxID=2590547 RepID=UPI001CD0F074|nr:RNase H family protein [Paenibacillus vietnamensis]MCA0755108.1 hypothetical protein [Paenibacillus vietnamensis]
MDSTKELLIKKAYATPALRQNLVNKGTLFIYCDYAGFAERNLYSAACCMVHNRSISITAKKLPFEQDRGSNYGECQAIIYSLEILAKALTEQRPKAAVIYTDCSWISRILTNDRFTNPYLEQANAELLDALTRLRAQFSGVEVHIRYIGKHKKNNYFHRLAHLAARQAAVR